MKIVFVVSSLQSGGAERVVSLLANGLAQKGYCVEIICLNKHQIFYKIDDKVNISFITAPSQSSNIIYGIFKNLRNVLRLAHSFKINSPDIIVSFITKVNILSIIANAFLRKPIIISERANPQMDPIGPILRTLRFIFYRTADRLVVQTDHAKSYFQNFGVSQNKIGNPVNGFNNYNAPKTSPKIMLGVGRLSKEKGFDLLIEAFHAAQLQDWKLWIVGDGVERNDLENKVKSLGLTEKVVFWGKREDVGWFYQNAGIFVLPSRHEGFPNSLLEAMSSKLPVIAFNCNYGPSEIITNGDNGILIEAENVVLLAKELKNLATNDQLREKLAEKAVKITQTYNSKKIVSDWEILIKQLIKGE